MSYLTFLALFSYTVLVKMEPRPSVPEWLVFVYISSTAVDKIREVSLKQNASLLPLGGWDYYCSIRMLLHTLCSTRKSSRYGHLDIVGDIMPPWWSVCSSSTAYEACFSHHGSHCATIRARLCTVSALIMSIIQHHRGLEEQTACKLEATGESGNKVTVMW